MKRLAAMLVCLFLAACGGTLRTSEVARYDFGGLADAASSSRVPIAAVEVQAASWLETPAMHFRLAYAEPLRRQSFAESRWAAPPAELLESFLKRHIVFGQSEASGVGCRMQLVLDELEQRFSAPESSEVVLEARVALMPSRGTEPLAKKILTVRQVAATPSAAGGAAATREAVRALARELGVWLDDLRSRRPAMTDHCRG